ncbi:hypothetical protein SpCBS45565_g04238 [Spizellomyces sp. 'palustris']|nr:hypothetical protein SpCBS45565_g04238 [Spizellomyces sp. 'palustris']
MASSGGSIMICRNKHYPYIASYHGPWLSLPLELLQSLFALNSDTAAEHPIDPVIFRHLITIRTLVDDASELVIKAAGGLVRSQPGSRDYSPAPTRMSSIRQHRLRELAVTKLAAAYRCDEIATSVLTMQSASSLDDVASKVLKRDPNNLEAMYVHHFHEKIPSRKLASFTHPQVLDTLIAASPTAAEYYRTRAMIHCFREEFPLALRDFKSAINLIKKRKRNVNGVDCEALVHGGTSSKHTLLLDTESQESCSEAILYFLRAACFHQYAICLLDKALTKVEEATAADIRKKKRSKKKKARTVSEDIEYDRPDTAAGEEGGTTLDVTCSLLEDKQSLSNPYWSALEPHSQQIENLIRRSTRDYHHFLGFYPSTLHAFENVQAPTADSPSPVMNLPSLDGPSISGVPDFLKSVSTKASSKMAPNSVCRRSISNSLPGTVTSTDSDDAEHIGSDTLPESLGALGTYHPLLLEAWFSIGINYLILRDWRTAAIWHERTVRAQEQVEGYPVFLPARSMSQADYVEILALLRKAMRNVSSGTGESGSTLSGLLRSKREGSGKASPMHVGAEDEAEDEAEVVGYCDSDSQDGETNSLMPMCDCSHQPACTASADEASGEPMPPPSSTMKQYPLHTKRAETVVMWIQASSHSNGCADPRPVAVSAE